MKKIYLVLYCYLVISIFNNVNAQINTFAGNGVSGYTGNGGAATLAEINMPHGIATDRYGNIYIADHNNNVVRKVDTLGIITTIAGTGVAGYNGDGISATTAQLNLPFEVVVDTFGNVYISDNTNHRLREVNASTGIISTIAGNGIGGYIGDGVAATATEIQYPGGLTLDATNNIIFADQYNHRVRKIDATTGIISTIAGTGAPGFSGDSGPATNAMFNYPNYVAIDASGSVYITDNGNQRIRKINTGIINTVAGNGIGGYSGDGGMATSAEIYYPGGTTIDYAGNLYIADYLNNRIRMVNGSGIINTIAGTGIAGYSGDGGSPLSAEINNPVDVKIDIHGHLYIADYANNRIRVIETILNHPPHFTGGAEQNLAVCENSIGDSINSLLAIIDTDAGQTETWNLTIPPVNGTVFATYSTISTGGIITPVGLYYTPNVGYAGTDVFNVMVSDGIASDETQVTVTIDPFPGAGIISGIDSVCPGNTVTLTETIPGGIWSTSSFTTSDISSTGVVTGLIPGVDTIIYTISNSCGIASALFQFEVLADCMAGINTLPNSNINTIEVYPNPTLDGEFIVNIFTNAEESAQLTITNVIGQKLKEFIERTNNPIDVKFDALPGIYYLSVATKNNKWIEKLVISSR